MEEDQPAAGLGVSAVSGVQAQLTEACAAAHKRKTANLLKPRQYFR